MPFSLGEVRQAMTAKLGFDLDAARRHPTFVLRHEGRIIAKTHVSHGAARRDVSDGVVSAMARQVGVTGPILRDAIRCDVTPAAFLAAVLEGRN